MRWLVIVVALAVCAAGFGQDAENVELVGRIYNYWDDALDVVVENDLAYVATGNSGVQIVDVSEPENPTVIGFWMDEVSSIEVLTIADEYVYAGDDRRGLHVVNINDPEDPVKAGFFSLPDDA